MQIERFDRRGFLTALSMGVASWALPRRAPGLATDAPRLDLAHDPERPEFHFLAPHNWMNDPNGPIWWKGAYHLFYQMNPHAAVWGDMHWGHAISTDMVHWRHLPIALAPTPGGPDSEGCFSGSAVVSDGVPTLLYTGVQNVPPAQVTIRDGSNKLRETQLLATAEDDELLHWKKLAAPVIAAPPSGMAVTGFRDPCPWREADGWYMAVGSGERGKGGCALLYRSADLRHWEYLHLLALGKPNGLQAANPCDSGEMWECPDFFAIGGQHCLLYSTEGKVIWSTGEYDSGEHRFTAKRQGLLDHGAFYAPKSFIAPDGRRVLWGWIQEKRPETDYAVAGWAGMISLPRVLGINPEGQLTMAVAPEVEELRGPALITSQVSNGPVRHPLQILRWELAVRVLQAAQAIQLRLLSGGKVAWELLYDSSNHIVRCGGRSFPIAAPPAFGPALRLFLDGSVVEAFIHNAEAITSRVYGLRPGDAELEVSAIGHGVIETMLWPLRAISPDRLTT